MAAQTHGMILGEEIIKALGLIDVGGGFDRVVIEADISGTARVYLRGIVGADQVQGIAQAVKDVQVSATGDVTVTPHPTENNG